MPGGVFHSFRSLDRDIDGILWPDRGQGWDDEAENVHGGVAYIKK